MIGANVRGVYLAPQNIPHAAALTFGNKVILYYWIETDINHVTLES